MKFIGKKVASKKGETLVGILIGILIIALSAGLFATMYTASMNINQSAREQDERFYEAVGTLEKMEESDNVTQSDGQIKYSNKDDSNNQNVDVEYLTQDGLSVYRDGDGDSGSSGGGGSGA